jgi:GT2 family glycosyltransferase
MTKSHANVTIVVSFRERWSLTEDTIKSIIDNTPAEQVRILLLDTGMPTEIVQQIEVFKEVFFISLPKNLHPNQARARSVPYIETEFSVFIDNDVIVEEGWLEPLLKLLEDKRVGIAAPLYMIGSNERSDKIHMAGGKWSIWPTGKKICLNERHYLMNQKISEVSEKLFTRRCDFAEFHAMAVKRDVFTLPEFFHPEINNVHEHIHASLIALRYGYETWFTPYSRIQYKATTSWTLNEQSNFRERWSIDVAEKSLKVFCDYWGVKDTPDSFEGVRIFLNEHNGRVNFLEPGVFTEKTCVLDRNALPQFPSDLLELAIEIGYSKKAVMTLYHHSVETMRLLSGVYRPDGRPFIAHLIGTAGVLVSAGANLRLVSAGLLHAALTHTNHNDSVSHGDLRSKMNASVYTLIEQYVRTNPLSKRIAHWDNMSVQEVDMVLLSVANDVEMLVSGEVRYIGRNDIMSIDEAQLAEQICLASGLPSLAASLNAARELKGESSIKISFTKHPQSFVFTSAGVRSAIKGH